MEQLLASSFPCRRPQSRRKEPVNAPLRDLGFNSEFEGRSFSPFYPNGNLDNNPSYKAQALESSLVKKADSASLSQCAESAVCWHAIRGHLGKRKSRQQLTVEMHLRFCK